MHNLARVRKQLESKWGGGEPRGMFPLAEKEYPNAHPEALKLRKMIGQEVGDTIGRAMEVALAAASTERDAKKKAKFLHIAETMRMVVSLIQKKVWNDLVPLLDPDHL
jgi:hypothetical protein